MAPATTKKNGTPSARRKQRLVRGVPAAAPGAPALAGTARAASAPAAGAATGSSSAGAVTAGAGAVAGAGGDAVAGNGSVALVPMVARQRIPLTVDPFSEAGAGVSSVLATGRAAAVANLFTGVQELHGNLTGLLEQLAAPTAPPQLIGVLLQPDSTAAGLVQVQFDPSTLGSKSPVVTARTDASGSFHLALPEGLALPVGSELELQVHGSGSGTAVKIKSAQIASNGLVGSIVLPSFVAPLPVSIVAALEALAPPAPATSPPPAPTNGAQLAVVNLGDCEDCRLKYGANGSQDTFPFGVFFRLVEPRASIVAQVRARPTLGNLVTFLPEYLTAFGRNGAAEAEGEGKVDYVDRIPVEQPISVDGFRDQLAGVEPGGVFTGDETRPMAGTLGLGYVLWMSQRWTLQGLALGDLVYSLPLAPGEQQEVAVFERVDTAAVTESEFLSEEQTQQQRAVADTSTNATFNSAFQEAVKGQSEFQSEASSSSVGASFFGLVSGGSGSSSSSGTSKESLEGQRNTAQQAAETTHSAAENQASARRTAAHTGMRLASASESESVTTKVVTNHNHAHALTMQYWEVQRLYDVTTAIDGLSLTVLVPLQVVRFMAPGQPATLSEPALVSSRAKVLARYGAIAKHGDVLSRALPRKFERGLSTLLQFVADPTAEVEPFGGAAEDVIQFTLEGTFVACEDVFVTAVTDSGTRVGPVRLTNPAAKVPEEEFASEDQLIDWLTHQRQKASVRCEGALALPTSMNRASIVGFEISRSFRQLTYALLTPAQAELRALDNLLGAGGAWINQALQSTLEPGATVASTVSLTAAKLEEALGGPELSDFGAAIEEVDSEGAAVSGAEQYANGSLVGVELPPQPYPVPARELSPLLRYNEILEIEAMAQHVVRETLTYSRAIWSSMSAEERAILLEAYTIGVPPGGVEDATQMIPLLNCVENRVLGFFGNSMIMPFFLPEALAQQTSGDGQTVETGKIIEALLAYQIAGFTPPRSLIALPTHGVLGEAVLGQCPSAEKIDITRFWNWQDSASDTAPQIAPSTLPTTSPSIATGEVGPNTLQQLPSLINNVLTAPNPESALLQALGADALGQKPFSTSLTGAEQLAGLLTNAQTTANSARADALKTTKELQAQAMATAGNIVGGMYAGNPNAGSSAAAAVAGKGGSEGGEGAKAGTKAKAGGEKGAEAGGNEKGKSAGEGKGGEGAKGTGGEGAKGTGGEGKGAEGEGAKGGGPKGGEAPGAGPGGAEGPGGSGAGGAVSGAPGPPPAVKRSGGRGGFNR
jgi:hypothetical protein